MLNCTYTKDKIKKSKTWLDGFLKLENNRFILFDIDKKKIYSFVCKFIGEEIISPVYIIYCEEINKPVSESSDENQKISSVNAKKNFKKNEPLHEIKKKENNEQICKKAVKRNFICENFDIKENRKKRTKKEILNILQK